MTDLFREIERHLARNRINVYVLLTHEDGSRTKIGPTDQLMAEMILVHKLWREDLDRRVVSASLVLP